MPDNFSSVTVAAVIVAVIGLVVVRVVVRRALLRESREPGINQTYLPSARYHDNPSFDEYIYVPRKTRVTRQSFDDQDFCDNFRKTSMIIL